MTWGRKGRFASEAIRMREVLLFLEAKPLSEGWHPVPPENHKGGGARTMWSRWLMGYSVLLTFRSAEQTATVSYRLPKTKGFPYTRLNQYENLEHALKAFSSDFTKRLLELESGAPDLDSPLRT